MPIQFTEEDGGNVLTVHVSGKLVKEDYERFVPEFERLVQQLGKLSMLFDMTGFHGWDAGALWEDTKFAVRHFDDIERLAMVEKGGGSTAWRRSASHSRKRQFATSITQEPLRRASGWPQSNAVNSIAENEHSSGGLLHIARM